MSCECSANSRFGGTPRRSVRGSSSSLTLGEHVPLLTRRRVSGTAVAGAALLAALALLVPSAPGLLPSRVERPVPGKAGSESASLLSIAQWMHDVRTAPASYIQAGAYSDAYDYLTTKMDQLPVTWSEVTTNPYNAGDLHFNDPASSA